MQVKSTWEGLLRTGEGPGNVTETEVAQDYGGRKTQEDTFVYATGIGGVDIRLWAVMDGTVGDFASTTARDFLVECLEKCPSFHLLKSLAGCTEPPDQACVRDSVDALEELFRMTDEVVLRAAANESKHYATSTCVVCLKVGCLLYVAHVGDSCCAVAVEGDKGDCTVRMVTSDHKPDLPGERARIERMGGSVEYLQNHQHKPFLRGGDFGPRKANGEQPMQLQYSRAFGGKDLKPFGLVCMPNVVAIDCRPITHIIIGSDGVWDMVTTATVQEAISTASRRPQQLSQTLVNTALAGYAERNLSADNTTCMVAHLKKK